jgi:hypothetical protein
MMGIGAAQAQEVGPLPDLSIWQVFAGDPTFVALNLLALAILVIVMLVVRRVCAVLKTSAIARPPQDRRCAGSRPEQSVEQLTPDVA